MTDNDMMENRAGFDYISQTEVNTECVAVAVAVVVDQVEGYLS